MKKLMMLVLILATTFGYAQDKKQKKMKKDWTPEQMAEKKTNHMEQTLDLTDAQKQRVYALQLEKAKTKKAKMAANKKKSGANYAKYDEQMKNILNDEQYAKWKAAKSKDKKGKKKMQRNY